MPSGATPSRIAQAHSDRARRAVEGGEEAVAQCLDLAAAEALELAAHELVVVGRAARASARSPSSAARSVEPTMSVNRTVASTRSGSARGAVPVRNSSISSSDGVDVAAQRDMVDPRRTRPAARRGCCSAISARPRPGASVAGAVQDQRRHADRRQDVPDVDLDSSCASRRCAIAGLAPDPLEAAPPLRIAVRAPALGANAVDGARPPHSRSASVRETCARAARPARPGMSGRREARRRAVEDQRRGRAPGRSRRTARSSRRPRRSRTARPAPSPPRPSPRARRPCAPRASAALLPVGQARAPLVEQDQRGRTSQPLEEARDARHLPVVARCSRRSRERTRDRTALADDLIGDVERRRSARSGCAVGGSSRFQAGRSGSSRPARRRARRSRP